MVNTINKIVKDIDERIKNYKVRIVDMQNKLTMHQQEAQKCQEDLLGISHRINELVMQKNNIIKEMKAHGQSSKKTAIQAKLDEQKQQRLKEMEEDEGVVSKDAPSSQ